MARQSTQKRRHRSAREGAQATVGQVVPALLRPASTSPRITGWPLAARLGRKERTDLSRAFFQRVRYRILIRRRNNSFIAAEDFSCGARAASSFAAVGFLRPVDFCPSPP